MPYLSIWRRVRTSRRAASEARGEAWQAAGAREGGTWRALWRGEAGAESSQGRIARRDVAAGGLGGAVEVLAGGVGAEAGHLAVLVQVEVGSGEQQVAHRALGHVGGDLALPLLARHPVIAGGEGEQRAARARADPGMAG